jgi:enoyl-CoA hydratase/carnithine racemase
MVSLVTCDVRDDGVALIQLEHPPVNALSRALLADLADVAAQVGRDDAVRAVVIAGGGKTFAAGADISEFDDQRRAREIAVAFRGAFDAVGQIPRPVLAAIHGVALGGGLELALACDLRIAADSARVGQPEVLLGIIPGAGATQRLPRLIGPARAKELIWSGRQVGADEALRIGLVDKVVPAGDLLDTALGDAAALAAGPTTALGLAKRAIDGGLDLSMPDALDLEAEAFVEVFATDDARIGVRSFLDDGPGKASFSGR